MSRPRDHRRRTRSAGVVVLLASALAWPAAAPAQARPAADSGSTPPAAPAEATPLQTTRAQTTETPNYRGTASLSNCSASIVRWGRSHRSDPALLLTNGHCVRFLGARKVLVRKDAERRVTLLERDGSVRVTLRTTRLVYATMFRTDVALYRLPLTYGQLRRRYDVPALTVSPRPPSRHEAIEIPSGYWRRTYRCDLNGFAYRLHEYRWDWYTSLRYTDGGCRIIGGTSGSPVLDDRRHVVGVNNTRNENGERCTLGNPCEENRHGRISVHQGRGYGQQTWWFTTCLGADRQLHLGHAGCRLPRP